MVDSDTKLSIQTNMKLKTAFLNFIPTFDGNQLSF